ncbi:MAG: hypothetical protein OXH57_11645 [Ekhidna sp.]|nr:hypothetical protein [Ekhidna sp.]
MKKISLYNPLRYKAYPDDPRPLSDNCRPLSGKTHLPLFPIKKFNVCDLHNYVTADGLRFIRFQYFADVVFL